MAEQNSMELALTRVFDAPRELVFKAWTDPALVAKWWGPKGVTNPVSEVDARIGGKLHVVMLAGEELGPMAGQRWPMRGEFKELVEPERLVFTNQAVDENDNVLLDGLTTVIFEEENGKTKLTMHTAVKGMSPQAPQMLEGMEAGWSQSLDKLAESLW
ncbi:MAG TPA: SRPBCC domain-containing protein [Candidatus Saccharimonadales bacterium]|jgi:uncharacterized protein YndB with AHSA1/START domain